jgi:NADH-ubiquinone oxidoreductase chain 2
MYNIYMLLLGIITLVMTIPLASSYLSTILIHRIAFLIVLFSSLLAYNTLYVVPLSTGIGLLGGLFQTSILSQSLEIFILIIGGVILLLTPSGEKSSNNLIKSPALSSYWDNLTSNVLKITSIKQNFKELKDYPLIVLFTTLGMVSLISSSDLIIMFLSIETQSFALYILATMNRNSESAVAAGLKYFLLGGLSSCFILLGSSLIYSYTGLTNFESLNILQSVSDISFKEVSSNYFVIGTLILTSGLLFKIAAAPFHSWAPDVYDGVPTIVTTWLTIMPKLSILVFFMMNNFLIDPNLLMISALLSLLLGSITGLAQYKIKRLLAYSTISHVGLILLALSYDSINGFESALFYISQYTLTSLNIFIVLILLGNTLDKNKIASIYSPLQYISQLSGQFYKNPILSLALALSLFSMSGIPPLIGFFGKYFVINTALINGNYFLSLVVVVTSVISAVYYLKIVKTLFLPSIDSTTIVTEDNNLSPILAQIVAMLTLFIIFFMLYPTPILNSIHIIATTQYYY